MPPFLPRKRSTSPILPRPAPNKRARLADALDVEATNNVPSLKNNRTFSLGSDDSDSDSSLSDIDSDQFENVSIQAKPREATNVMEDDDEDEDEEIEWEDAAVATDLGQTTKHVLMANGPIQITLRRDEDNVIDYGTAAKAGSGKKGPSKREKAVRVMTHKLHVQFLLWHNAVRNSWIADKQLQDILVKQLPPQIIREVAKWRRASGITVSETEKPGPVKGKRRKKTKQEIERSHRDWGQPSQRLEPGKPDLSHGDPLIMLLKVLSAYWKKRFAITTPGLRKRGYGTKHGLKQEIVSLRNDEHDPEKHGERVQNLTELRKIAKKSEGSRDVGAQLFTALLRGLGIETRLVASLQPSGYGWTKAEQMIAKKPIRIEIDDDDESEEVLEPESSKIPRKKRKPASVPRHTKSKSKVISLDTDDEDALQNEGDSDFGEEDDDVNSVIDVTPSMPKQKRPRYDRDLAFPIYWAEAVSPITKKVYPVSPLVLETPVADRPEILSLFEPRGAKAEKTHQVMAYVVGYSSDGTAKDVTVRYLRKQIWPGKTKGFRVPIEKVPIYDQRGKIKRYENYDWFKHVLSFYLRSDNKRTAVDDVEDASDLVPQQPEKKNDDEGIDTLQSLKTSADFVLERFLRREEALRPGAEPVRTFASGKGDKYREEPVYRRVDVERCLTAESWHKEGRRPKLGETPMKMVPVRAVTLTRKREAEEHERQYGEKQMQGLYSWDQTEWIIPAPIKDGIIPKNAYGNMDCFVPSMVPKGAVHVPLKGTVRICKKLEIDFAEAVTGFEFGNKRAVPVCTGVVVAVENERLLKDAWKVWNEEQRRKEETKMEKLVLDLWRKFVLGLRIRERVQDMYGEEIGVVQDAPTGYSREDAIAVDDEDDPSVDAVTNEQEDEEMGGGFLLPHEEATAPIEDLIMDDQHKKQEAPEESDAQFPTPKSLPSATTDDVDLLEPESSDDLDADTLGASADNHENREEAVEGLKDTEDNQMTKEEEHEDDEEEEGEEEEEKEEEEIYTPRSTRTRTRRSLSTAPISNIKPTKRTVVRNRGTSSATSRRSKGNPVKREAEGSDSTKEVSALAKDTHGRGRPRKSGQHSSPAGNSTSTPNRSTRSRKKRTASTSPYFQH